MTTYTRGYTLQTERIVTKDDIMTMCELLNSKEEYSDLCEFQPEPISEGGIVYKFKNNKDDKWYKSVRLCVNRGFTMGQWYFVNEDRLSEWIGNDDFVLRDNSEFTVFLKSFDGAPPFTLEELKIWEQCFNQIGIVRKGKYPSKKSLRS